MSTFYVLIYAISLTLPSLISLDIHNQHQGINLTSPVYFIHGGGWHVVPDQEIDVNAVMRSCLEFDSGQDILEGALVYRIQRKHTKLVKPTHNESRYIQLLVVWSVEYTTGLHVHALIVKHDKKLDEVKLKKLHQMNANILDAQIDFIGSSWLLDGITVLKTTVKVMNGGYKWDVFISEGVKDNIERPLRIDTAR
jgi:hypothetical protein